MRIVTTKFSNIRAKIQVFQGFQPLFPGWFWQVSHRPPACDQQSREPLYQSRAIKHRMKISGSLLKTDCSCSPLLPRVSHLSREQPSEPSTDGKSIFFSALIRDNCSRTVAQGDLLPRNLCFASGVLLPGTNPSRLSPPKNEPTERKIVLHYSSLRSQWGKMRKSYCNE